MRPSLSFVGVLAAFGLVACGISVVGAVPDDGGVGGGDATAGGDGGGKADGWVPVDGAGQPEADACAPSCTLPTVPAGWSLVVFGGESEACPAGFESTSAIEGPTPGAGACACGACVMAGTTCNTGSVPVFFDNSVMGGGTCDMAGAAMPANDGACSDDEGRMRGHMRVGAPPAVPGTCTRTSTADKTKVTKQAKRVCAPQASACLDSACNLGGAAKACVMQTGALDCPTGLPDKHVVGRDFTMACGACGCTISATCTGSVKLFPKADCEGIVTNLPSGVCTLVGGPVDSYESYKWTGTVATETCNPAPAPVPSIALTEPRTICCP